MPSIGRGEKLSRTTLRKIQKKKRLISVSISHCKLNQNITAYKNSEIFQPNCYVPNVRESVVESEPLEWTSVTESTIHKKTPLTSPLSNISITEDDLKLQISNWAIKYNVKGNSVTELLKILSRHSCFQTLPKDSRSLLKTPRDIIIKHVTPGTYCHFPLAKTLLPILKQNCAIKSLDLQLNTDGLPVSNSSAQQFWPILAHVVNFQHSKPFAIGIYYGEEKPKSSNDFLKEAVTDILNCSAELTKLLDRKIDIKVSSVICDAPARSFILNVKGHTGYYGCQKCEIEGEYYQHRMTFEGKIRCLRTDFSFRSKRNEDHHLGENSELLRLPIDIVNQVPLDYQHLVCLGVVRKLLNLWVKGPVARFRFPNRSVHLISQRLIKLKPYFSKDFSRKPRSLIHLKHWKATEYRSFLLYSGPLVLKGILPDAHYVHFLCLHVAITILCSKRLIKTYITYAESLLQYFVENFKTLYGQEQVSYNIHNILHLVADCRNYGVLDLFSTFKFESYLGKLKTVLRSPNRRLEQIHNRIQESQVNSVFVSGFSSVSTLSKEFTITCNLGENCCLLEDGSGCLVDEICDLEDYVLRGRKITFSNQLYCEPCSSSLLGIGVYIATRELVSVNSSAVKAKALAFPDGDVYYVFPLLHTSTGE